MARVINLTLSEAFEYLEGTLIWKVNKGRSKIGTRAGSLSKKGYRTVTLNRILYQEHHIIWYLHNNILPKDQIDHINQIRDDNRIENLREVTQGENLKNKTKYKSNTSGVVGVGYHNSKWRARINVQGREILIGMFNTVEEAISKRKEAEILFKYHENHGSDKLSLRCPIYAGTKKKYLLSLNWLQDAHYRARNKVKQEYHAMIGKIIPKGTKLKSPLTAHYKIYYKNKLSDAPNIYAVVDKFLMDALQEYGVIEQDNVQHYVAGSWEVIEQDRINPRIEVEIIGGSCG